MQESALKWDEIKQDQDGFPSTLRKIVMRCARKNTIWFGQNGLGITRKNLRKMQHEGMQNWIDHFKDTDEKRMYGVILDSGGVFCTWDRLIGSLPIPSELTPEQLQRLSQPDRNGSPKRESKPRKPRG